ncbi:MAG: glutamine--tRNA ligase/YqeY domain fusion protein [Clostridia bacterium]|nr:glutamine--tRNA ligase/YqeY domain fusion protein [Clostridia bacterium]
MENEGTRTNFIWDAIDQELAQGRAQQVHTRFPPEPNGYLHIGHCKALVTDFGTAEKYGGLCNLRFDDTNPAKEDNEYAEGIKHDIEWLGFHWTGGLFYASDYYERLYDIAEDFINRGLAYVDELSADEMREYRGTLTTPGKNSPWRDRPIEENLSLFRRMKNGEFPEGKYILRAKIDMASPNMNMRDPAMYRILYKEHWRMGNKWCIYPMYDFAHPLSDAFEGITYSLCSLEFEDHRPLYDWFVEHAGFRSGKDGYYGPRQIEFARLNITRTVMSKRHLRRLVEEHYVSGWDDPRMPTLCAMRRRGYPGAAIRNFVEQVGLSKADSTVDVQMLDACVRDALGNTAPRVMAVLNPVKVVLTNVPDDWTDTLTMENHPDHAELGERQVTIGKEIWIEREDFMEEPPKKYFRLKPDGEVRLKGAYIIKCENVVHAADGSIDHIECSVDLTSRSGSEGANRKVKGTIHWVNARDCAAFEARLYDQLMTEEWDTATPEAKKDVTAFLSPDSLQVISGYCEHTLVNAQAGDTFQFLRVGYFCKDKDSTADKSVYNRVVSLKDGYKPQK